MAKINARKKGHQYELKIAAEWRELGYTDCITSRLESKKMDDMGVDLVGTNPYYIQCKAVENLGNLHKILAAMPKEEGKINLVFHKRNRQGEIVAMNKEDFYELLRKLIACAPDTETT